MATSQERMGTRSNQAEQRRAPSEGQSNAPENSGERSGGLMGHVRPMLKAVGNFWMKISNDWIMNLSGLLAYNLLMAIFPILLVLLAIAGFFLNAISPGSFNQLENHIQNALPGGGAIFQAKSLQNLSKSAGLVFIIGIVTAIFTGSRFFITLENCFGIIFRLRGRDALRQNMMAIGMLLVLAVLVPLVFLASLLTTAIDHIIFPQGSGGFAGFLIQIAGIVTTFVVAAIFLGVVYVVVPNRPVRWREVWKGTFVAAALLVLYEILFPIYESHFLKPGNYGSLAGFAILILVFFYYLGFILLLGAEINSWASGQRQTAGDITAIVHEVQAHNTTRGAAGPTAGTVAEDMQSSKGERAMSSPDNAVRHERQDHHTHIEPPKYAEAGAPGPEEAAPETPEMRERTREAERETKRHHRDHDDQDSQDGVRDGRENDGRGNGIRENDGQPGQRARETGDQRHPVGSA